MNNILHEQLNKLRIISKVRAGQRLDTTNDLTVYEESLLNWLLRKYYHDNKDEGVRYLQDLYRSIQQTVEHLISDISTTQDSIKKFNKIQVAINLAEKIKSSITGIENLSKTYSSYPKTTAMLEGIIQDYAISIYVQLLEIIPKNKYTKALNESVSFLGTILYQNNDINKTENEAENIEFSEETYDSEN